MKAITMAILGVIAAASIAVIAVFGVKMSPLVSSVSDGMDFSQVSIKAEAVGISSSSIASLMPLAQAFTGGSFVVEGTTNLPSGTTQVTIPGLDMNLMATPQSQAAVQASGWAFTQAYTTPDNNISVAVLTDNAGNKAVFAAVNAAALETTPSQYIYDLATQYYDMLTLFGFKITTPPPSSGDQLQTVTAEQEDIVVEVRAWIDPSDPTKVNIAALKSTPEDINIAGTDFATFAALLGGT